MMDKDFTMPLDLAWREYERRLIDSRDWGLHWEALIDECERLGHLLPDQDDAFESWLADQRQDFEDQFQEQVREAEAILLGV